jgi:hypothetical protein
MANENALWAKYTTGETLVYCRAFKPDDGQVYNVTAAAFQGYNSANWAHYAIAMDEETNSGWYVARNPAALSASVDYPVDVWVSATGTAASTDTQIAYGALGPRDSLAHPLPKGDEILARVNAARVVYSGPVSTTLSATIIQGDDYLNADGEALTWTIEDYTGPSVTSSTAGLKIMTYADYIAEGGTVALSVTATAAMVGDDLVLKADLTAAQTAALDASPPDDKWNYVYQVIVTLSNGHVITPARATGAMTVQKRIG